MDRDVRSAPPRLLDPILALAERLDRARLRLAPIRPDGLLHLHVTRYRGAPLELGDGTTLLPGATVGMLHIDNAALRRLMADDGGRLEAMRRGRGDLRALAEWTRSRPADRRPVAFGGHTILASVGARAGFEVREIAASPWSRLVDWYLRGLLARWSPEGRERLRRGHGPLRAREAWISAAALERRYGPSSGPRRR